MATTPTPTPTTPLGELADHIEQDAARAPDPASAVLRSAADTLRYQDDPTATREADLLLAAAQIVLGQTPKVDADAATTYGPSDLPVAVEIANNVACLRDMLCW